MPLECQLWEYRAGYQIMAIFLKWWEPCILAVSHKNTATQKADWTDKHREGAFRQSLRKRHKPKAQYLTGGVPPDASHRHRESLLFFTEKGCGDSISSTKSSGEECWWHFLLMTPSKRIAPWDISVFIL